MTLAEAAKSVLLDVLFTRILLRRRELSFLETTPAMLELEQSVELAQPLGAILPETQSLNTAVRAS
jgi:hypothetical protein